MPVACWFGGQFWRQSQSTRVGNIFLGFLLLSLRADRRRLKEGGGPGGGYRGRGGYKNGLERLASGWGRDCTPEGWGNHVPPLPAPACGAGHAAKGPRGIAGRRCSPHKMERGARHAGAACGCDSPPLRARPRSQKSRQTWFNAHPVLGQVLARDAHDSKARYVTATPGIAMLAMAGGAVMKKKKQKAPSVQRMALRCVVRCCDAQNAQPQT